jgi:methionine synthase II (cobalamin-independent)
MGDRVLTTVVGSYPQPDWLVDDMERAGIDPVSDGEQRLGSERVPALMERLRSGSRPQNARATH